jgi:hypothetical protein
MAPGTVQGLIEIDTGLQAPVGDGFDDLTHVLVRLGGGEVADRSHGQLARRYENRFLRADVDQLERELQATFEQLLDRLFEGG